MYSAIWPTSGWMRNGSAYQRPLSAHPTPGSASSSSPAKTLFRTPLATDSTRGGESLDQVRARRGTIALSHQIIDLALNGPAGSQSKSGEPEMLWSLIEDIFTAGDATPTPSPAGNTHHRTPRASASPSELRGRPPPGTSIRRMAHGPPDWVGCGQRRPDAEPADHRARQRRATSPGRVRTVAARRVSLGYERAASSGAPGVVPSVASRRVRIRCLRSSKNDVKSARSSGRPSRSFSVR